MEIDGKKRERVREGELEIERERERQIYGFPTDYKGDDVPEHTGELPDGVRIVGQPANKYSINIVHTQYQCTGQII